MKKGFTLIELLAVILILGIIALIAIPTVTNMIEESKRGALRTTALTLVKQAQQACTSEMIKGLEPTLFYTINDGKASGELNTKNLPKSGEIELDSTCKSKVAVSDGKYCVITDGDIINFVDDGSPCVLNPVIYTADKCFTVENNVIVDYNFDIEDCNSGTIVVPSVINGQQVKEIGEYGFTEDSSGYGYGVPSDIELIDLSHMKYLETIQDNAFSVNFFDRWGDETVGDFVIKLPTSGSLKTIGVYAFYEYRHDMVIPEGVTSIGNYAFYMGYGKKFTIPSTVTTIGNYAFYNTKVEKIINKTGLEFNWNSILGSYCSNEDPVFAAGTCIYDTRTIEIVNN